VGLGPEELDAHAAAAQAVRDAETLNKHDFDNIFAHITDDKWVAEVPPSCLVWNQGDLLSHFARYANFFFKGKYSVFSFLFLNRTFYNFRNCNATFKAYIDGYNVLESGRIDYVRFHQVEVETSLTDANSRNLAGFLLIKV